MGKTNVTGLNDTAFRCIYRLTSCVCSSTNGDTLADCILWQSFRQADAINVNCTIFFWFFGRHDRMTETQWLLCCISSPVHYLKEVVPWKLSGARSAFLYTHPTRETATTKPAPQDQTHHTAEGITTMSRASDSACQHKLTAQRPPHGGTDADFHVERLCSSRLQELR